MALSNFTTIATIVSSLILLLLIPNSCSSPHVMDQYDPSIPLEDAELLEFAINLEYLEAEFFLYSSLGYGLEKVAPNFTTGTQSPIGGKKANLDPITKDIIEQFAWQEVGHLRAIKKAIGDTVRPFLDLTSNSFATVINNAFGHPLSPPFDPYASRLNYLIASYIIPYVGLTGYVGANRELKSPNAKTLVAGLLAVESGQDAIIRALLYEHASELVHPYGKTVAEFTNQISNLRNKLGRAGVKDEGLIVPINQGAEGKIKGNVLVGDEYSVGYGRTPEEILRVVYGGGDAYTPGGFYPGGARGVIARGFRHE